MAVRKILRGREPPDRDLFEDAQLAAIRAAITNVFVWWPSRFAPPGDPRPSRVLVASFTRSGDSIPRAFGWIGMRYSTAARFSMARQVERRRNDADGDRTARVAALGRVIE